MKTLKTKTFIATAMLIFAANHVTGSSYLHGKMDQSSTPRIIEFIVNGVKFNMVFVEGGTFQMGVNGLFEDAKPVHQVKVNNFYIGQTEVTQELWEAIMGSNPSASELRGQKLPVTNVSWDDCEEFIAKLQQLTGKNFRLPTEAEWEYAARGGKESNGYIFSGGNTCEDVAWFNENRGAYWLHEVATKKANELGLYDMSGNVSEWCHDWYDSDYYCHSVINNPTGPEKGNCRVVRGGSCYSTSAGCWSFDRAAHVPNGSDFRIGFRFVL